MCVCVCVSVCVCMFECEYLHVCGCVLVSVCANVTCVFGGWGDWHQAPFAVRPNLLSEKANKERQRYLAGIIFQNVDTFNNI